MSGLDQQFMDLLKSRVDLVDIAGRYVTLSQKGNNFWACCPFHHEKTASFKIDRAGQFYYCFGCHASGDVVKFVQEMESVDFVGAVRILCEIAGLPMPELVEQEDAMELRKKRDRLYALMKDAALFYNRCLKAPEAKKAQEYIARRGIAPETVKKFGLGFCPGWTSSLEYLRKLGYTDAEMREAGIAEEKNGRHYDVQGDRLIFPVIDAFGQVIAFGGRILEKADYAKYKNTKETVLFNKSTVLYGINLLKKLKQEKGIDSVIVVEGYMDVISLWQAGFENVVANMGTALTQEQAKVIRRMTERVFVCYDGDGAGIKAAIRGTEIFEKEGLNIRIVTIPDGQDPDDLIKKKGPEAYRKCLERSQPITDFKLSVLRRQFDLRDSDGKRKYIKAALKVISTLETSAEKEDFLKRVSAETSISPDALRRDLSAATKKEDGEKTEKAEVPKKEETSGSTKAVRYVLNAILNGRAKASDALEIEPFLDNLAHVRIFAYLKENEGKTVRASALYDFLEEPLHEEAAAVLTVDENLKIAENEQGRYFKDCLRMFKRAALERELATLNERFRTEDDINVRTDIVKRLQTIASELRKV